MKVLLVRDVERVGWLGDVVEVSAGYARNYLLPYRLAVEPSSANVRAIRQQKTESARLRKIQREQLEKTAAAVNGAEIAIAAKANEQGHLFGSVGPADIAAKLREQGFEVADSAVQMSEHIKQIGRHQAMLKFAEDLTAAVEVVVVSEEKAEI